MNEFNKNQMRRYENWVKERLEEGKKELDPDYHGPACGCDKCLGRERPNTS